MVAVAPTKSLEAPKIGRVGGGSKLAMAAPDALVSEWTNEESL